MLNRFGSSGVVGGCTGGGGGCVNVNCGMAIVELVRGRCGD